MIGNSVKYKSVQIETRVYKSIDDVLYHIWVQMIGL